MIPIANCCLHLINISAMQKAFKPSQSNTKNNFFTGSRNLCIEVDKIKTNYFSNFIIQFYNLFYKTHIIIQSNSKSSKIPFWSSHNCFKFSIKANKLRANFWNVAISKWFLIRELRLLNWIWIEWEASQNGFYHFKINGKITANYQNKSFFPDNFRYSIKFDSLTLLSFKNFAKVCISFFNIF